jgi:protein-tyrosine phosphatase
LTHHFRLLAFDPPTCYAISQNGDLNWIVHDRILAFAGPHFHRVLTRDGYYTMTPADYVPYFKAHRVDLVIRLNKRCYNETDFIRAGIRHFDQYYMDGSCPTLPVLQSILTAMEGISSKRAFAVHCKAGLGRTGTCIGAYLMKHFRMTAGEAIGWMRICRPGMVIGPQQQFLVDIQDRMWHEGDIASTLRPTFENRVFVVPSSQWQHSTSGNTSPPNAYITNHGDNPEKGSPKSVTALLDFFTHSQTNDGTIDVKGSEFVETQADGLLARRKR